MSRFRNEVIHLQAHVRSLRWALIATVALTAGLGGGWWHAAKNLTVHVPPDLRTGSTRKWWEVPPESVYAFTFYIFQQLNRWPSNGEVDYFTNIQALSSYLTPACKAYLEQDFEYRRSTGELKKRVRGVYEIPGRGYGKDPESRVRLLSNNDWVATLDLSVDEYHGAEQVKRALVQYTIKVARMDVDPEKNPFGLVLDCYEQAPKRISLPTETPPDGAPS